MELQYIREFTVLARILNYSAAADELNISQSVLSKHILALERELGAELIDRSARKIALTGFGAEYLPFAIEISVSAGNAERMCADYLKNSESVLTIGTVENLQAFDIDHYLIGFHESFPSYRIKTIEAVNNRLEDMFNAGSLNIFTTCLPKDTSPAYPFIPMFRGHIKALVRRSDKLSSCGTIDIEQLGGQNLLLPPINTRLLAMIEKAFRERKTAMIESFNGNYKGAENLVRAGLGIALLPSEAACGSDDLAVLEISPSIDYLLGIGHRQKRELNRGEKAFVEYAARFAEKD